MYGEAGRGVNSDKYYTVWSCLGGWLVVLLMSTFLAVVFVVISDVHSFRRCLYCTVWALQKFDSTARASLHPGMRVLLAAAYIGRGLKGRMCIHAKRLDRDWIKAMGDSAVTVR